MIDLMKFGRNIQNALELSLHVSVFLKVCFLSTFRLSKPDTENNANFDAESKKMHQL